MKMATYKVFEIRHAIFFFLVEHILDGLKAVQYLPQSKFYALWEVMSRLSIPAGQDRSNKDTNF